MTNEDQKPPKPADATASPQSTDAPNPPKFAIVGIGASAGGLEAIEALVHRLSVDHMSFVIVQHLAPARESILTDLIATRTTMPVVTIKDGMAVEPNRIYVAPPGVELTLNLMTFYATRPEDKPAPRHPIDTFFRSLAEDHGALAIGVVLSGSGNDGTVGLKAIKEKEGITFVQDPATAMHRNMPQSALDSGYADFSLSPSEIGDELMRLSSHPYVAPSRKTRILNESGISRIFALLRAAFGVDFTRYKRGTIERRIERRMAVHRLDKLDDYIRFVEGNATEQSVLFSDLLIGVTSFFRDSEAFEELKSVVFPRLFEGKSQDSPFRVWVAGTSTGEEAYSIAICLLEFLGERSAGRKIQIFGTDLDEASLAHARHGVYPQSIEVDVSKERLQRFFSKTERGYQISRQIRDMVVFARHNLSQDPPFSRLDLVSCRNVLIYMQPSLQRKVLRIFHYALNPDTFLLLGTSESVGDAADMFSLVDRKLKLYVKKNTTPSAIFEFTPERWSAAGQDQVKSAEHVMEIKPLISVQQLADRKVLEKYGPPGVLINSAMEIIQFRGRTGPYLEPAPGVATLNLCKLARPELLVDLRSALHRVTAENLPVTTQPIRLRDDNGFRTVTLDIMPLQDSGNTTSTCMLVLFRETPPPRPEEKLMTEGNAPPVDPRILELERELALTKEYLQSTIEELEAANEELKSSNEELQSSNEELQSTNEELETSKEELQSTNEELNTVNDELQHRMTQLNISNDDLQNIMMVIDTPLIIVGMDLRIRRFSFAAERVLNLIPADVGRPVAYLKTVLSGVNIEQTVSDSINSIRPGSVNVRCADGIPYTLKVVPYRTADHAIRGVTMELMRSLNEGPTPLAEAGRTAEG